MEGSVADIRGNLKTQLEAVSNLQDVKSGRVTEFSGFPACRFYLTAPESELKDNTPRYWRSWIFTIDVFQEMTQKSVEQAEHDMQDAIEAVMDKLNEEWLLDDNVDVSDIQGGNIVETEMPFGPSLACSITFAARLLV